MSNVGLYTTQEHICFLLAVLQGNTQTFHFILISQFCCGTMRFNFSNVICRNACHLPSTHNGSALRSTIRRIRRSPVCIPRSAQSISGNHAINGIMIPYGILIPFQQNEASAFSQNQTVCCFVKWNIIRLGTLNPQKQFMCPLFILRQEELYSTGKHPICLPAV